MNFAEQMAKKSEHALASVDEVKEEILHGLRVWLSEGNLAKYIESRAGRKELENRRLRLPCEFWAYRSGCSETHFVAAGYLWTHPTETGYRSHDYRGVDLCENYKGIVDEMVNLLTKDCRRLGFTVGGEYEQGLYGHYWVIIEW